MENLGTQNKEILKMQEQFIPTLMMELCKAVEASDACSLLARAVAKHCGAWAVGVFLLDVEGRALVLTEPHRVGSAPAAEIKVDDLDDPLCYCVKTGNSVCYSPPAGMLPKSISQLANHSSEKCRGALVHPLIAPGKKMLGALICLFKEGRPENEIRIETLCLYGSAVIDRFLEKRRVEQIVLAYKEDILRMGEKRTAASIPSDEILGTSEAMQTVRTVVMKAAVTDAPILITGATGTGKSLVAKVVHKYSNRCNGPFTEINCGAIPESLLESELFGHRKGSFSGATSDYDGLFRSAEGGTVFLDEIAEMPFHLQSVLLHVLQEHKVRPVGSTEVYPVNVRIVAATNKDLEKAMQEGAFRRDLYHRIAVVAISIPPLAERKEDIIPLTKMFFKHFCQKYHRHDLKMSQELIEKLLYHDYEGNTRELSHVIERSVMLSEQFEMDVETGNWNVSHDKNIEIGLEKYLQDQESKFIQTCFSLCNSDWNLCASVLGIHPKTLLRKFKKYDLH